jgi:integral membrane protein (TIGR01906 family)
MKAASVRLWQHVAVLLSILFLLACVFFSVKLAANDEAFYAREFEKLGNAAQMGMSGDYLTASVMRMVDYMENRTDSIDIDVTVHGERVSMFNDRERAHMLDVRRLYQGFNTASFVFLGLYALFLVWWLIRTRNTQIYFIMRAFLRGSVVFGCLAALAVLFALIDFTSFWTAFHRLFFTNDLWILDASVDRMIMMMPQQLFFDIVVRIVLQFAVLWALLTAGALVYTRRTKRRHMRNSRDVLRRAAEQHVQMEHERRKMMEKD